MPRSSTTSSTEETFAAPSVNVMSNFNALNEFLDYNTLAAVEATCKNAPKYHATFEYVEIPFTQEVFPWSYSAFGKLHECTSTCVFVALLAAEKFALGSQIFKTIWKNEEVWWTMYEEASRLHSEYFHRMIEPALEAGGEPLYQNILMETLRSSVFEFHESLHQLGTPFDHIKRFAELGSPTGLLDKCDACAKVSDLTVHVCPCGKSCPRGKTGSPRLCIDKADEFARANPQSTIASLITIGDRTFFFGINIHDRYYVYIDSHHRSWAGDCKNTSLIIYGAWCAKTYTYEKLWPVISRGATRYSDTEQASIVAWKIDSSSVPEACLPATALGVVPGSKRMEDESRFISMESPAAAPLSSSAVGAGAEPATIIAQKMDNFSVPQACPLAAGVASSSQLVCLPVAASGVAPGTQLMEDESRRSSMESPAAAPLASTTVASDTEPTAIVAQKMDNISVPQECLPAAAWGVAPDSQFMEHESRLSSMESRIAEPLVNFACGMNVRLQGLSNVEFNNKVGVVVNDEEASARGRVVVQLHGFPRHVAVKPMHCTIVYRKNQLVVQDANEADGMVGGIESPVAASSAADAAVPAREEQATAVLAAKVALPSTLALQRGLALHSDEGGGDESEEEADVDELDVLLRQEEHQNIVKVYPDAKNEKQLIVCYACDSTQTHRSRTKASYYLKHNHFVSNGNPRKVY